MTPPPPPPELHPGGVRRRYVDHDEIRQRCRRTGQRGIVLRDLFSRGLLVRPQVEREPEPQIPGARPGDSWRDTGDTFARKAEPVDQRPLGRNPPHPGARIPWLGTRRDRPNLRKTEAERVPGRDRAGVLIHPGGKAERIREGQTADLRRQFRRVRGGRQRRRAGQRGQRQAMGQLGVEPKKQGPQEPSIASPQNPLHRSANVAVRYCRAQLFAEPPGGGPSTVAC